MMNGHTLILNPMKAWNMQSLVMTKHARDLMRMGARLVSARDGCILIWMKKRWISTLTYGRDLEMMGHASLSLGRPFLPQAYRTLHQYTKFVIAD